MRQIRLIVSIGYLLLLLQTILSTMFIGSIEARISFMTKLKILALFALAKKVDVLPLPLPIPIPIHIDDKDELVHMESTLNGYYHRPPNYYYHYHNRPKIQAPYFYSTGNGNNGGYYSAHASELSPVTVPNYPISLRYGDRISANHRPTYNIRKFRNRPIPKSGLSDPKTAQPISENNSIYKQNSAPLEIQPPISTTVAPLSIQSTAGLNSTFENTTTPSTINADNQDNNLDNVNLKDIKIIFIPIKSLAAKKNENNEMVSDMKKFSDELSNQLNSNENSHAHYNNEDFTTETNSDSNPEQPAAATEKPIDYTRLIKDYIAYTNNTNNSTLSNAYSIDPILPEEPKLSKIEPNVTTTTTTPVTTSTSTTITSYQDNLRETNQPTKPEIAVTGFEIPSLQDLWLKQNQYVPRASYYRAPKLKVYHHLKTQPPYYDDDNHYPYGRQANSANHASNYNSKPIYSAGNQWLRTSNTMPVHNANNVQFLYTITHNDNNNNNNYRRQPSMALPMQEYPIADRKFGLGTYHPTANMFSGKSTRLYADNNGPDGKLITSSSIIQNWIQPKSHNYPRKPLLNAFNK